MMGERRTGQEALFYEFSLERHVPSGHLLRRIDQVVDLSGLRTHLRPFYSEIGRPSICPELMIRMLIVGYCLGIRSERRLCEEVHLNLAYRWFCRLGLEGDVPDHSTFSKIRSIVVGKIRHFPAGVILAESVDEVTAVSGITDNTLVGVLDRLPLGETTTLRRFESTFPDHREIRRLPQIMEEHRIFGHRRYSLLVTLANGSFELCPERCETVVAPRGQR